MTPSAAIVPAATGLRVVSGTLVVALPFLWAIDPFGIARANLVMEQLLVAVLGAAMTFVYCGYATDARRGPWRLPAFIVAVAILGACTWLAMLFGAQALIMMPTGTHVLVSGLLIATSLVALTLHAGYPMAIVVTGFLLFGYFSQFLSGPVSSAPVAAGSYIVYMVFGGEGLLGRPVAIISTTVLIFVYFGVAYEVSGGTRAISALAMSAARHGRGTAIKVAVLASGLFGTISGSVSSNVLTSGAFSIPGMKRLGVPAAMAGGVEAVASTGGQIMPPIMGAAAFLMSDLTGIRYGEIALASLLPALVCYAVLFQQADRLARRVEAGRPAPREGVVPDDESQRLGWSDLLHVAPVLGIVVVMTHSEIAVATAGLTGIALSLAVSVYFNGVAGTLARLRDKAGSSAGSAANLVVAASTLGIVLAVMNSTGLDIKASLAIRTLGESSLALSLIVTALAAFVLGMGMTTSGVYVITGTLLAPGLIGLGVPVLAAHLFVLYCGVLSMITPPVAIAALSASALAGAGFQQTAFAAVRFGWILFFAPVLFVLSPGLLLIGAPVEIAIDIAATVAFLVCLGLQGAAPRTGAGMVAGYVGVAVSMLAAASVLPGDALRLSGAAAGIAILLALRARQGDTRETAKP